MCRRASPGECRRRRRCCRCSFCFGNSSLSRPRRIHSGRRLRQSGSSHPFSFWGPPKAGPSCPHNGRKPLSSRFHRQKLQGSKMGNGNGLLQRGSDSHCRPLLGPRQSKRGGGGGNSGFELSLLIQHIDLMDSHARDAPLPPSAASVSDAIEALNGTECHRGGGRKKSSFNSYTLQLTRADNIGYKRS